MFLNVRSVIYTTGIWIIRIEGLDVADAQGQRSPEVRRLGEAVVHDGVGIKGARKTYIARFL